MSFALESFDRADEKAKTEQQKERLTRMFAALGATNEAIMRAKSRTELFELVCEAATVGGNFTSTAIALARARQRFSGNRRCGRTRPGARRKVSALSTDAGRARRSGYHRHRVPYAAALHQQRLSGRFRAPRHFYSMVRGQRHPVGRGFPLLKDGRAVGVIFLSPANSARSAPELIELLQRLADNVSFALDNFERADEKAKTEEQKERLTRMLAALSATNEAIVRARSRDELFELVCEAAANGGKFTSTTIALVEPDSDFWTSWRPPGRPRPGARRSRLSVNESASGRARV